MAGRIVDPEYAAYSGTAPALARLAIDEGPPDTARAGAARLLPVGGRLRLRRRHPRRSHAPRQRGGAGGARGLARARHPDRPGDRSAGGPRPAWVEWASALDLLGRTEQALEAWLAALAAHREQGRGRPVVAAGWAPGAPRCRLEDWGPRPDLARRSAGHRRAAHRLRGPRCRSWSGTVPRLRGGPATSWRPDVCAARAQDRPGAAPGERVARALDAAARRTRRDDVELLRVRHPRKRAS